VPQVPPATTPPVSAIPSTATATAPAPPPVPVDPLGRTTPHGCVLGFLRAAEAKDYEKAANYLDGKRPGKQAEELAQQLKYLLDQGLSTSIDDLSRSPSGNVEDQQRLSRESVGTVKTPSGDLKVMLDQVERPSQPAIWLVSQETLHLVPAAYASLHPTDYEHYSQPGRRAFVSSQYLCGDGQAFSSSLPSCLSPHPSSPGPLSGCSRESCGRDSHLE
jgi:MscS family membrane protein